MVYNRLKESFNILKCCCGNLLNIKLFCRCLVSGAVWHKHKVINNKNEKLILVEIV